MTAGRKIGAALLEIDDISLAFGGVVALQAVSFDVHEHEIRAIIGPNGAGKSSMLNVINGVYHPQQGTVAFKGRKRHSVDPHEAAQQGIARTFQNIALFRGMTVLDNIMTGRNLKMKSNFLQQAVYWGAARREELEHRAKAEVLLLDEPMAGMNLEEKQDMSRFILDANDQFGTTIVLIEHDMSVVMDLSDRVIVLNYGRKIADGTPEEVRNNKDVIDAYLGVAH